MRVDAGARVGIIPKHNCVLSFTGVSVRNMPEQKKPKTVVIIDDDESVRSALEDLMNELGFPAVAFACAEEFLDSGEQQHTACLIADIRLPGMSGLDLQSRLNEWHLKIPILFITAHGDEKLRMRALRSGAVEFLIKPFNDEVLVDNVKAALEA